jgi:hypothetical protein
MPLLPSHRAPPSGGGGQRVGKTGWGGRWDCYYLFIVHWSALTLGPVKGVGPSSPRPSVRVWLVVPFAYSCEVTQEGDCSELNAGEGAGEGDGW